VRSIDAPFPLNVDVHVFFELFNFTHFRLFSCSAQSQMLILALASFSLPLHATEMSPAQLSNEEAAAALVAAVGDNSVDMSMNGALFSAAPQSAAIAQSRNEESIGSGSGGSAPILPIVASVVGFVLVLVIVFLLYRRRTTRQRLGRVSANSRDVRCVLLKWLALSL
jgi:hypothetical protein